VGKLVLGKSLTCYIMAMLTARPLREGEHRTPARALGSLETENATHVIQCLLFSINMPLKPVVIIYRVK